MKALSFHGAVAAAIVAAAPLAAQVTPAEIWADWQANAVAMGAELTADVTDARSSLTMRNLRYVQELPDGVSLQAIPEVRLIQNNDGTVSVEIDGPVTFRSEIIESGRAAATFEFLASFQGLDVTASGQINDLTYDYSVDLVTVVPGEFDDPNFGPGAPEIAFDILMRQAAGSYQMVGDVGDRIIDSTGTLDGMEMTMSVEGAPGDPGSAEVTLSIGGVTSSSRGALGPLNDFAMAQSGKPASLPMGLLIDASAQYDSLSYAAAFVNPSAPQDSFEMSGSNAGGAMATSIDDGVFALSFAGREPTVFFASPALPVPLEASADGTGLSILMPIAPQPDPANYTFALNYTNLQLSDQVWGLLDPSGAIPRDPITVRLDLSGTVLVLADLAGFQPSFGQTAPVEPQSLAINELFLSAAGAQLTGAGQLRFQQGPFMPMPQGVIDLQMNGLSALLQNLAAAGLVPPQAIAGVSSAVAAFARPGPGPDSLEATIEFLPDGTILSNGVPLPLPFP